MEEFLRYLQSFRDLEKLLTLDPARIALFGVHRTFMLAQGHMAELNFRHSQGNCFHSSNQVDLFFPRCLYVDFFNKDWDKLSVWYRVHFAIWPAMRVTN